MDTKKVAFTILAVIVMAASAILPSTDETTNLHTEEPLFLKDNSKDRTKDSNTNSAFKTVLKFTPGTKVSWWTTDMKQENTTHMPKKNERSKRDINIMEKTTSYLALDHDMKTRESDVTQSVHDSDDVTSGTIPLAHSEVFSSSITSNNKNMTEHTKASDSLGTSVSTRKTQITSNDGATNAGSSKSAFLDKRTSPYDKPVSDETTISFPYAIQQLEKSIAASTTVTTYKATTHKEMHISTNTAVSVRTTHDLPGATKVIETTLKKDPFLTVEANATTSVPTTVSTSTIKAITMATPSTVNPKPTAIKVTKPSAMQTPSTITVTTPSIVNSKPASKPVAASATVGLKSTLLTMTTPSTVKLKPTTIKMTTPSVGKTNPATVKITTHSVVRQEPATSMVTTTSTVKPKQTSELMITFSTLKSTRTTMMMAATPSPITSKMVTILSYTQPKQSTVKVITSSNVQTKQAAMTATTPSTPEQKTTSLTVKSKPTTIPVNKHSTVKPKSTTITITTTLKPMTEATTSEEINAPTHNRTFEEHISHTTVKSGGSNNTFSSDVTSTIGYSEENNETESENTTTLFTEEIDISNTTLSPASSTILSVLQWATGFTQARKPGVTNNPLQDPDKLQIQQPTLNPLLNDDTYWPVAMALTIGIPSIIVFAVTITVLHRMRKSKFMGANMYRTL